jgi:hypothetical protein
MILSHNKYKCPGFIWPKHLIIRVIYQLVMNNNNTNVYSILLLMVAIAAVAIVVVGGGGGLLAILPVFNNAYGQATTTTNQTQATEEKYEGEESMHILEHIPLTGQLDNGDYLHLIDFTPFNTTAGGHVAIKVPCYNDGKPMVTMMSGVAPNFTTLNVGNPIYNGTLDGRNIDLSIGGTSCLYHGEIPNGITDIALANTSNQTLSFDRGGYSVVITAHAIVSEEGAGAPHKDG